MAYDSTQTTNRSDNSLIPNTQIESMFLRVCADNEMQEYMKLIDSGHTSLATAYASNKVFKMFYHLVSLAEDNFGTVDAFKQAYSNGKAK